MTNKLPNIVVVGQGAMGLLWYHHLSQARYHLDKKKYAKISLLSSTSPLLNSAYIYSAEYQFTAFQQDKSQTYPLVYSQPSDIEAADIILLCLKSYSIAGAFKEIAKNLPLNCIVILAHNGMGVFEEMVNLLPREQVILAMLTTHGCLRHEPLNIKHTGLGHTDIGILSGEFDLSEQKQLTNLLNDAQPEVTFHQDITNKQWVKLAINCVINPITAINNIDNGEVNREEFTELINLLLSEIIEVSNAEIGCNDITRLDFSTLQKLVSKVALATGNNCSSMRSDILANRPTEIDYINGYIHRLGKQYNIATPENTRLWQEVKALD